MRVERLKQAVMENLRVDFAKPYPAPFCPPYMGAQGPALGPYGPRGPGMYRGRGGLLRPPIGPHGPQGHPMYGQGQGILGTETAVFAEGKNARLPGS